jgi:hypothetical protein
MPDAGDLRGAMPCAARLAVLIMGHANPAIFGRLTGALDDPRIRLFAHIEKRSDQSPFEAAAQAPVRFMPRRVANLWGSWTQIEVMMDLLRAAHAEGPFTSYVIISADTLPLLTPEALLRCLEAVPTVLQFGRFEKNHQFHKRVSQIFVPTSQFGRLRERGTWMDQHRIDPSEFDDILAAMRTAPLKEKLRFAVFKGSQWMAISERHLTALFDFLARDPDYTEIYRYSLIPDESYIHSAIKQIEPKLPSREALMGLHWPPPRGPSPLTLTAPEDIAVVGAARTLFFRKFADTGLDLADAVLAGRRDFDAAVADGWNLAKVAMQRAVPA